MKVNHKRIIVNVLKIIFIFYIMLLTYFLFFSEHYGRAIGHSEYRYNLTLFKEFNRFIVHRDKVGIESFIVNIFGNIFAFSPIGFILPVISPDNRKLLNIMFLTLVFSFTIEILQLISKVGIFDVDDLLMNTLGGLIGYIFFKLVFLINKKLNIV